MRWPPREVGGARRACYRPCNRVSGSRPRSYQIPPIGPARFCAVKSRWRAPRGSASRGKNEGEGAESVLPCRENRMRSPYSAEPLRVGTCQHETPSNLASALLRVNSCCSRCSRCSQVFGPSLLSPNS
jgi:hypothetical protein